MTNQTPEMSISIVAFENTTLILAEHKKTRKEPGISEYKGK